MIQVVLITGMAGAGKSTVLKALEDLGYYCIDNLPLPLLSSCIEVLSKSEKKIATLAVVVDTRNIENLSKLPSYLETVRENPGVRLEILFLDAKDDILIRRFSSTRHKHPTEKNSIVTGIKNDRNQLVAIRESADYIINTSSWNVHQLRQEMFRRYEHAQESATMMVSLLSFGFKNGLPLNADLVFDVRFLDNPYFAPDLREKNGLHPKVREYVLSQKAANTFLTKVQSLLFFLLPKYQNEGKIYCTVAIGCTGGQHRSVAVASELLSLIDARGYATSIVHRDMN